MVVLVRFLRGNTHNLPQVIAFFGFISNKADYFHTICS